MAKKRRPRPPGAEEAKRGYLSVRISPQTVKRLDKYVQRLRNELPGGYWTRSSAALNLIVKGLEAEYGR